MQIVRSLRGLLGNAMLARGTGSPRQSRSFQDLMAEGWRQFDGEVLLILSGQDYTAKEFLEYVASDAAWSGVLDSRKLSRVDVADADHTFSSEELRSRVENETLKWLATL